jgi:Tol biopolymer transport system component
VTEILDRLTRALADRYRIERELGQGGMATVYLAEDIKHKRKVALKVLKPELAAVLGAERFVQEITTTASLQHPHILPLYDSGAVYRSIDGSMDRVIGDATADRSQDPANARSLEFLYYVMPFIDGETLRDKLNRETQLGVDEAVRITTDVADALDYAHRQGVIHRDIKPENILLHDGRPMVADFGIALAVSAAAGGRMTETGLSLGTPYYMSPEQATAEKDLSARSDVYSLGCVLYEMLTGNPPHTGASAQQIIMKIVTEEAAPVTKLRKSVPGNVAAAVATAVEKLPADRFATAGEFAAGLADPAYAAAGAATGSAVAPRTVLRSYRRAVLALAAVSLVTAALAAWGWLRGGGDRSATWQYVLLGDSLAMPEDYPAMALSPDGQVFVFKDNHQNGLLWIKQRSQLDPVAIPGTERAQNPRFSPDGAWIIFVADGHLKKIRATGGASVTLADSVSNGFGGAAWLDDGTIVYVTSTQTELRRVSAAGGTSARVLQPSDVAGAGVGHPEALPGGRGVLLQYCSSGCVTMGIHVLDLRSGQQKLLLNDVAQAWYLPNGHLLYVRRDGVAMVAPFDLDRLEITGEAVPVLEGVDLWPLSGFALLTWSPSGSLVYVPRRGGPAQTTIVRVDRHGTVSPVDTAWYGQFNSLALAPDGRRMAVGVGAGIGLNIWIKQLDRGPFTRLSFGNQDRRPAWSADGRFVAFVRDSANTSAIVVRAADGGGSDRRIVTLDRMVQEVAWSPDGRWLVVRTDNTTAGAGDLVALRADGDSTVRPLVESPFTELHPAVSPDGRWLAYTSNESGTNEVYVRPFPDAGDVRWQVSNGGGSSPVWSPTGRELFFIDSDGGVVAAEVSATAGGTFAVGRRTPLFDSSGLELDAFHTSFSVAPDGRTFVFISRRRPAESPAGSRVVWVDHWLRDLQERLRQ